MYRLLRRSVESVFGPFPLTSLETESQIGKEVAIIMAEGLGEAVTRVGDKGDHAVGRVHTGRFLRST
jgi:hypothetical protein